jgi:hypothetical protein
VERRKSQRGSLLSSIVMVMLATVATGMLAFIGFQALPDSVIPATFGGEDRSSRHVNVSEAPAPENTGNGTRPTAVPSTKPPGSVAAGPRRDREPAGHGPPHEGPEADAHDVHDDAHHRPEARPDDHHGAEARPDDHHGPADGDAVAVHVDPDREPRAVLRHQPQAALPAQRGAGVVADARGGVPGRLVRPHAVVDPGVRERQEEDGEGQARAEASRHALTPFRRGPSGPRLVPAAAHASQ